MTASSTGRLAGWYGRATTGLDRALGRFTMYRLVTVVLGIIAVAAIGFSLGNQLQGRAAVGPLLAGLAVLLVSTVATGWAAARAVGRHAHLESSVITALLLWFLYWPTTLWANSQIEGLVWLAVAGLLATVSKYVIAWRGRHLVNPAAAAAILMTLLAWAFPNAGLPLTSWWVASQPLFWFCLVGAFLVLYRTRRLAMGVVFALVAAAVMMWALASMQTSLADALKLIAYSSPVVFLGGFMLSEPLTLPPRRWQQVLTGAVAGVIFAIPLVWAAFDQQFALGPFRNTQELLFVVTGVMAFAFGQRSATLTLKERVPLGGDTYEYVFEAKPPLAFNPGQYAEVHVPHRRADLRGTRRMLSLASAPGDEVRIGVREPERASSFKRTLAAMQPGAKAHVAAVHGDFLWPAEGSILLVAGGIGITPFISQLSAFTGRDVVLVYGVRDAATAPYADRLAETGAVVHLVEGDALTADSIVELVPDAASRATYLSGPPAMVDTLRVALLGRVATIDTDVFLGY